MAHTTYAGAEIGQRHFWKHAVLAGLIGGAVFMMAEMLMVMLIGESPWAPPHMIAAMALGPDVLPSPGNPPTFDMGILMTAMMIHFPLAIVYGLLIGWAVTRVTPARLGGTLVLGAVIGLAIYLVNFYVVTGFAFEWFAMARNWVSTLAHMIFGLATAWAFFGLAKPEAGTAVERGRQ